MTQLVDMRECIKKNEEFLSTKQRSEFMTKNKIFAFTYAGSDGLLLITLIRYSPDVIQLYSLICQHLKADKFFTVPFREGWSIFKELKER